MKEMDLEGFWKRVDELLRRQGKSLTSLCEDCHISYSSVNTQRKRNSAPKVEQLYIMSQYLSTTIEYLLTGREETKNLSEPMKTVVSCLESDSELFDAVCSLLRIKKGGSSSKGA